MRIKAVADFFCRGVPFESLLPYAICLGVGTLQLSYYDAVLRASTVLRVVRCGSLKAQKHAEWWQEAKTRHRPMGQTEYEAARLTSGD